MGALVGKDTKEYKLMIPALQEMKVKDEHYVGRIKKYTNLWQQGDFLDPKVLGSGASCRVLKVTVKANGQEAALKEMKRNDEFNPNSYVKEIAILDIIKGHDGVLKFERAYIDNDNYYIQTGLLRGGELFDRIHDLKKFKEAEASRTIMYVLDAIHHCHVRKIVHRDLKPENMVYSTVGGDASKLCIIDFGDAKKVRDEDTYEEFVGTAFYLPPEIVRPRLGREMKKSDVWSIGVICYVLLTGRPPFWGNSNKEILKKIIKGKVQFPKSAKLSATAKHFVLNMVQKRIDKRFTTEMALNHPFITNHNKKEIREVWARHQLNQNAKKATKSRKR